MIFDTVRDMILAGIGLQEIFKEFISNMVKKGELSASQGTQLIKEWSEKAGKTSSEMAINFSEIIKKTLDKMNLPTKDDIDKINLKINSLSTRISELEEKQSDKEQHQ
ncbi:ATP synthase subunit B [Candidatus Magnetoovum chiemensis]|nr:ATP synthase subunit B [Candidatus Magnetoovum chiemensis]